MSCGGGRGERSGRYADRANCNQLAGAVMPARGDQYRRARGGVSARVRDTGKVEDVTPAGQSELGIISAERLNFFSDAVLAIAITLLALDLHVPDGPTNADLWRDLSRNLNDYVAFLISFAVIGNYWFLHHRIFGNVTRLGGWLTRWNMLWLLTIVLTPFATRVIVGDGALAARFSIYAMVQALASIFFLLAVREMDRHRLVREGTARTLFTRSYLRLSVMAAAFLVSIPLAFITHWAYLCWVAIPFGSRVQSLVSGLWHRLRPVAGSQSPDR
jgi:TMEM175 potassium channel family protein